jgi:hypothetical protein
MDRYPISNGSWSNPAIWDSGLGLPTAADDVYANGKTVQIDQSIEVVSLNNAVKGGILGGGLFRVEVSGLTVRANLNAGITNSLLIFNILDGTLSVYGNITGGNGSDVIGLYVNTRGTINVYGNVSGSSTAIAYGINNISTATLNIVGNIVAGASNRAHGIYNSSTGEINLIGNCTGGYSSCIGINNLAGGTVNITGNVYGKNTYGYGVSNSAAGILNITGNVYGGNLGTYSYGVYNSGACVINGFCEGGIGSVSYGYIAAVATATLSGNCIAKSNSSLFMAGVFGAALDIFKTVILGGIYVNGRPPFSHAVLKQTGSYIDCPVEDGTLMRFINPSTLDHANTSDVRKDTVYNFGGLTGTLIVADPASILKGVPTDNTVGTAVITKEALFGEDADEILTGLMESIQKIDEFHSIHGLKAGSPLEVTDNSRKCGDIEQTIEDDGETTTVTRI